MHLFSCMQSQRQLSLEEPVSTDIRCCTPQQKLSGCRCAGADGQGPWAASLQGGDAAMPLPQAQQQQPQHQQQHLQPGAAAPTLEAVPVPHIAADPVHLDRAALPQVRDTVNLSSSHTAAHAHSTRLLSLQHAS
jgi:hypothetical protein